MAARRAAVRRMARNAEWSSRDVARPEYARSPRLESTATGVIDDFAHRHCARLGSRRAVGAYWQSRDRRTGRRHKRRRDRGQRGLTICATGVRGRFLEGQAETAVAAAGSVLADNPTQTEPSQAAVRVARARWPQATNSEIQPPQS